MVLICFETY